MEESEPLDFGIPDQPTEPLFTCAHCGAGPIEERICVPCSNAFLIALKAQVSMGDRSDWTLLNHREMLCLAAASMLARESGAYIPYTTIVHLVIARAIRRGDL